MNDTFKHSYKVEHFEYVGLAVYNCGIQKCEEGHSWGPAVRDHYLIHYILSGKGSYETGGQRYELTAGDGFLAFPSTVIHYRADGADPWEYSWVGFNGTEAERLVKLAGLSQDKPIFHCPLESPLAANLVSIFDATGSRVSDEIRMRGRLMEFLSTLIEYCGANETQRDTGTGRRYIEKALRFIQYNYFHSISVGDIADSVGISRSHLYRLFIEHLSMSPNEYLTRFRIDEACVLLRSQGLSVSEAAFSSGFSDQLYFSRVFKRYKGVPPSKYALDK